MGGNFKTKNMDNLFNVVGNWMLIIGLALFGIGIFGLGLSAIMFTWGGDGSFKMVWDITITILAVGIPMWVVGSFIAEVTD